MLHSKWSREFSNAIEEEDDRSLELLLEKSKLASRENVGSWQVWQALRILADRKKSRKDAAGFLSTSQQLVKALLDAKQELDVALGTACAELALEQLCSESEQEQAFKNASLAFDCLTRTLDPSPAYSCLINEIRQTKVAGAKKDKSVTEPED